jgi:hypothetical protein
VVFIFGGGTHLDVTILTAGLHRSEAMIKSSREVSAISAETIVFFMVTVPVLM